MPWREFLHGPSPGAGASVGAILALTLGCLGAEEAPPPVTEPQAQPPELTRPAGQRPGEEQSELAEWTSQQIRWLSRSGDVLGTAIFDLLEDLDLYKIDIGDGSAKFSVGRKVFDNHDVLGSYTVVDRFRVRLDYPLYTWSKALDDVLTVSFSADTNHEMDFLHIRQVASSDFDAMIDREEVPENLIRPGWQTTTADRKPEESRVWNRLLPTMAQTIRPEENQAFDGLSRARWNGLWNLLVVPFRVPFKPEWIDRIAIGDILSWRGSGTISAGPGISADLLIPGALEFFNPSLSYRLHVNGSFRISVLRESKHHVRVRITREAAFGRTLSLGGETDGVMHLEIFGSDVLGRLTKIIPLSANHTRSLFTGFDLVYRYDLRDPDAREAYRLAVFGQLAESDELSGGAAWRDQAPDRPVQRIAERSSNGKAIHVSTAARWGSLYKQEHSSSTDHTSIVMDVGEGPKRAFRSRNFNVHRWRWFWGAQERFETNVTVWVDRDRLDAGADDAVTLTLTHEIVDTITTGDELHQYIALMEDTTGRVGFFPRPPVSLPPENFPVRNGDYDFDHRTHRDVPLVHPVRYGRSSFFAQATYSQDQLQRFLAADDSVAWSDLEQAFGHRPGTWGGTTARSWYQFVHLGETLLNVPLYPLNAHLPRGSDLASARSCLSSWRQARGSGDLIDRVTALVEMFASRRHGWALTRLLRIRLPFDEVSYVIKGSSYAFGTLREEGTGVAPLNPLPEQMTDLIEFDTLRARRNPAAGVRILRLQVTPLDHNRLEVDLTLPDGLVPLAFYVRLIEQRPWSLSRSLGAAVVGQFDRNLVGGQNRIIIDRRQGPLSDLLRLAEPGIDYTILTAISADGRTWGPISETGFTLPPPPAGAREVLKPILVDP